MLSAIGFSITPLYQFQEPVLTQSLLTPGPPGPPLPKLESSGGAPLFQILGARRSPLTLQTATGRGGCCGGYSRCSDVGSPTSLQRNPHFHLHSFLLTLCNWGLEFGQQSVPEGAAPGTAMPVGTAFIWGTDAIWPSAATVKPQAPPSHSGCLLGKEQLHTVLCWVPALGRAGWGPGGRTRVTAPYKYSKLCRPDPRLRVGEFQPPAAAGQGRAGGVNSSGL